MRVIRSERMRRSARGEECTFQIPGVCNGNPETTVLCHLPDESHGMAMKSDDLSAAYGCSSCHDAIDRRVSNAGWDSENSEWYMRRAQTRTLRRMVEIGVLIVAGVRK